MLAGTPQQQQEQHQVAALTHVLPLLWSEAG
jgi:hypothetical protein